MTGLWVSSVVFSSPGCHYTLAYACRTCTSYHYPQKICNQPTCIEVNASQTRAMAGTRNMPSTGLMMWSCGTSGCIASSIRAQAHSRLRANQQCRSAVLYHSTKQQQSFANGPISMLYHSTKLQQSFADCKLRASTSAAAFVPSLPSCLFDVRCKVFQAGCMEVWICVATVWNRCRTIALHISSSLNPHCKDSF